MTKKEVGEVLSELEWRALNSPEDIDWLIGVYRGRAAALATKGQADDWCEEEVTAVRPSKGAA